MRLRRLLEIAAYTLTVAFLVVVLVKGKGTLGLRLGLIGLWVVTAVVLPWWSKRLGLPKRRPDEAYITSLRRWRRNR